MSVTMPYLNANYGIYYKRTVLIFQYLSLNLHCRSEGINLILFVNRKLGSVPGHIFPYNNVSSE